MAPLCHPFWIFRHSKFLHLLWSGLQRTDLRHWEEFLSKSVKPSLRYRDFCDFQDGRRRHLGFSKIRNFNGRFARCKGQYASPYPISPKSVEQLCRYGDLSFFTQHGGLPPPWICCWARIWTTHDEYSVVFSVVQNLVGIDAVVLIILTFQYFAR